MKKIILVKIILLFQFFLVNAQEINQRNGNINIDTIPALYPVVQKDATPANGFSAVQNTSKRITVWLEPGDGFFTTDPLVIHPITNSQSHCPLMLATNIYDTSKDLLNHPPTRMILDSNLTIATLHSGAISFTKLLSVPGVKITPNVYDIVPGDPMAFAITYKTPGKPVAINNPVKLEKDNFDTENSDTVSKTFKLYFLYNNTRSFKPVVRDRQGDIIGPDSVFLTVGRKHNSESILYNFTPPGSINKLGFTDCIQYLIPTDENLEKTVFVSMMPYADLEIGKSGSVYAVLTDENDNILGTDIISNMPFGPAHDPNYLVQRPYCLKFPKKEYPFEYKIHFQNTGPGNATAVKVVVHLPKALNAGSLVFTKASFAGVDFTAIIKSKGFKIAGDSLVILFTSPSPSNYLLGTAISNAPASDPKTMGEVLFTVKSTPNTEDVMEAQADIYFKSEHPSANLTPDGYEKPVTTNKAITKYKDSCVCRDCPVPVCFTILGLCWWWWLIILAVLALLMWFIITKRRKDKKDQHQGLTYNATE